MKNNWKIRKGRKEGGGGGFNYPLYSKIFHKTL